MAHIKLKDVINRVQTKVDKDNTSLIYYVGGEHIESENVCITKRGLIEGSTIGPMFYYGFKAGDFLLVSRNPHLKKAGVVGFDGICSEKTFVLATANSEVLLPEYLPFILQNDTFWEYAYQHRHGSTNTFINWSTLANYEFELPNIEIQRKLAEILWAINDTMESYKRLILATDELVKSQFIEITQSGDRTPTRMGDIATYVNGYAFKPQDWSFEGVPIIRIQNLNDASADFNRFAGEIDEKYLVHNGDVLVSWATHLEAYLWNGGDAWLNQHIFKVVFDKRKVNKVFFIFAANYALKEAFKKAHGFKATMEHIKRGDFEDAIVMMPDLFQQEEFATLVRQSDKSKFELEQALSELTATYKRIISEQLG